MINDECPAWCTTARPGAHEHVSGEIIRNGFRIEVLRYWGDDTTRASILEAMDGGQVCTVPLAVLVDLMAEVHIKVAA